MSTSKRPRTPAQQSASRSNGAKSHGPVTEIGKQRSSLNALKHGLCAASVLLPDEDEAECQELIEQYELHYRPLTSLELARVREIALCDWRLRRTTEIERGLFTLALHDAAPMQQLVYGKDKIYLDEAETHAYAFRYSLAATPTLALLLRYQAQLQRSQERARKALKQLQAERQQQEWEQAAQPNEPKPVPPAEVESPAPSMLQPGLTLVQNEPEQAPTPAASLEEELPNEPKRKLVQSRENRTRPPQ